MDFNRTIITENAQATAEVGRQLAVHLKDDGKGERPRILCLYGELGSGKTTFTQGFAQALGISQRLLSPTFIIVRRYDLPEKEKSFYHIDLYRLHTTSEMEELGLSEIFSDPNAYVVIEWADRLEALPEKRLDILLKTQDDGKHSIAIKQYGHY